MRLLAVGDIVGWPGVKTAGRLLRPYKKLAGVDFAVVNGENASGLGITPGQAEELYNAGADVITLGNHAWARREIVPYISERGGLLRPANFAPGTPGAGYGIFPLPGGKRIAVINLIGRALMDYTPDNPFFVIERVLRELAGKADAIVIDFHAEATSEKLAMLHMLAGRVSVLFGTHTHVQTADERVYNGTGYITDLGMTGPTVSVLGVKPQQSVSMYRGALRDKFETADGPTSLCGALFDIDLESGACLSAERVVLA